MKETQEELNRNMWELVLYVVCVGTWEIPLAYLVVFIQNHI